MIQRRRRPTNLYRTLQMKKARQSVEDLLYSTAKKQLGQGFSGLQTRLRRLKKDEIDDFLDEWEQEWLDAFDEALMLAFTTFGQVEEDWYGKHGIEVGYDSYEVVRSYKAAQKVSRTTDKVREEVGKKITDWFTSDAPIDDLIESLSGQFGESRARLIAINETTTIGSFMTLDIMRSAGLEKWSWETRKDDIVCPICGDLDGQIFTSRDDMPPDASHIGCRCGAAPVIPLMEEDWEE